MQLCECCKKNPFKYKCPRCAFKSCSLDCSKTHKIKTGCSGERSKTHYVPLKQYSYNDMMSDYGYLEDMSRQADTLSRLNMKNDPKKAVSKNAMWKQKGLVNQAERAGIRLSLLPAGMKRRKINNTNYNPKQRLLFWTVEFIFPACEDKKVLLHRIPASKPMRELLDDILTTDTPHASDALTRFQLQKYIDSGTDSFVVGLKKDFVPADQQNTFIDMTPMMDAPLADILKGESLCEFPIFNVWIDTAAPAVTLEEKSEIPSFRGLHTLVEQTKKPVESPAEPMEEVVDASTESSSEEVSSESEAEKSDDDVSPVEMGESSQTVEASDVDEKSPPADEPIATSSSM
ncbi:hypothetical protein INT44_007085 [Umbelopsis vinacea]|uniref:HIT-type domain-containing protein n=1 Tax=Umbelopsis vinacea TaxID=44442 RepID=A0A8H7PH29_9FUNG|nr:hypothetical protein INT44_007085 [Umbelopsis vinacea]